MSEEVKNEAEFLVTIKVKASDLPKVGTLFSKSWRQAAEMLIRVATSTARVTGEANVHDDIEHEEFKFLFGVATVKQFTSECSGSGDIVLARGTSWENAAREQKTSEETFRKVVDAANKANKTEILTVPVSQRSVLQIMQGGFVSPTEATGSTYKTQVTQVANDEKHTPSVDPMIEHEVARLAAMPPTAREGEMATIKENNPVLHDVLRPRLNAACDLIMKHGSHPKSHGEVGPTSV